MSTAPTVNPSSAAKVHPTDKFTWDKSTQGDVTLLTMKGTLNEGFDGRKLADGIRTKKVLMVMRDVRRIASWGMAEWMDFLRVMGERDLYIAECSTYSTSQLNLVTGLLGHAKFVSFYAGYRCRSCSAASESLFVIPRDRQIIRDLPNSEYECAKCGGSVRLEEYPAAFFDTIADREPFDIEDDVLELLRTRFKYEITPDVARFRAGGATQNDMAYLRLSGNLVGLVPERLVDASLPTTVVDVEGVVVDDHVGNWRAYMDAVLPKLKQMQLVGCPVGFLDHAVTSADLRNRVKVRSFAMPYECQRCQTRTVNTIDVAENLEELVQGKLPGAGCPSCQSSLVPLLTPDLLARLKAMPARDRDPVLEKFFTKARTEPASKLQNLLLGTTKAAAVTKPEGGRRSLFAILGVIVVLLGGVTWFAIDTWRKQNEQQEQLKVVQGPIIDAGPEKPTFVRPDWITSDALSSAYCRDMINRVMCVGVSAYTGNRDEAVAQATDAALEELVYAVGLRITAPFFKDRVATPYADARNKLMAALNATEIDRTSKEYAAALDAVVKGRKRVVESLRATGGPAVPTGHADWYWEEYVSAPGKPNDQLVFMRFDIGVDALRVLVEKYSQEATYDKSSLVTVFPGLAWQRTDAGGGAMVLKSVRSFARAGLTPDHTILSIDKSPVVDAAQVVHRLQEAAQAGKTVDLTVSAGTAAPKTLVFKP